MEPVQNQHQQEVEPPLNHAPQNSDQSQTAVSTLWLAVLLVALDQITKLWVTAQLSPGESWALMPSINFTLVYNYGAAFSFLADMGGWQRWFFSLLAFVVSGMLVLWLRKLPKVWTLEVLGLNFILSGAIGNVIDRLYQGKVTDFIDFYLGNWHYATFNVADICVFLGAMFLLIHEFWLKPKQAQNAAN